MSNSFFFRKICRLRDNLKKIYCRTGRAIDDMAHAHFMLDTQGYRHIFKICKTYCFFTGTMLALTRLSDMLQAHLPVLLYPNGSVFTSQ